MSRKKDSVLSQQINKPFLRWAGGKSWLVKYLSNVKVSNYNNYHEAFLGGGATFFNFKPPKEAFLSDLNPHLVETYQAVKENVVDVIETLQTFENTEEFYYELRAKEFSSAIERAARFIYLNQTSFNGIYRVNLKGVYNVPYGFRSKNFLDIDCLINSSQALKKANIFHGDFYEIIENVNAGDLVFLDPPYTVSHNNNGFIKYNEKIFSLEDQKRLGNMIDDIKTKGAFYILTNAAHVTIEEIFDKGDVRIKLNRASLIGGKNSTREHTDEYLFTNTNL